MSCSPRLSRQRCPQGLCQDKSIREQVTVQSVLRTSYLCKPMTGKWKLFRLGIHMCAYALCVLWQMGTTMGSFLDSLANLFSQPVLITAQQVEAAAEEVQPAPPVSDGCLCHNAPAQEV